MHERGAMKSVKEIIEILGGLERLKGEPIQLTVEGFMPLSIEYVGVGPGGGLLVSVMHFFTQQGDLMRDPDLVVEILVASDEWLPVSYQQDSLALYQEAVSGEGDSLKVRSRLVADLRRFMELWSRNLEDQGFVEAARLLAQQRNAQPPTAADGEASTDPAPEG
jgi:hypothetical protein